MSRRLACCLLLLMQTTPLLATPGPSPENAPRAAKGTVIFYLHGRFVEEHAAHEASPEHGRYDYDAIVQALARRGAVVESERRARDTDVSAYAAHIAARIDALIDEGRRGSDITVVGASKGAVIAALVSARIEQPDVRYVLMAACNDWLEQAWRPRLHGHVLSIHEASDPIAGSCGEIARRSTALSSFVEIKLDTGLGHGFLYRPLDVWVEPALEWSQRGGPH